MRVVHCDNVSTRNDAALLVFNIESICLCFERSSVIPAASLAFARTGGRCLLLPLAALLHLARALPRAVSTPVAVVSIIRTRATFWGTRLLMATSTKLWYPFSRVLVGCSHYYCTFAASSECSKERACMHACLASQLNFYLQKLHLLRQYLYISIFSGSIYI